MLGIIIYLIMLLAIAVLMPYVLFFSKMSRDTRYLIALFVIIVLVATAPLAPVELSFKTEGTVIYTTRTVIVYQTLVNGTPTLTTTTVNATVEQPRTVINYAGSSTVYVHLAVLLLAVALFAAYSIEDIYNTARRAWRR